MWRVIREPISKSVLQLLRCSVLRIIKIELNRTYRGYLEMSAMTCRAAITGTVNWSSGDIGLLALVPFVPESRHRRATETRCGFAHSSSCGTAPSFHQVKAAIAWRHSDTAPRAARVPHSLASKGP